MGTVFVHCGTPILPQKVDLYIYFAIDDPTVTIEYRDWEKVEAQIRAAKDRHRGFTAVRAIA